MARAAASRPAGRLRGAGEGGEHRGVRGRSRGAPPPERPRFSLGRGRSRQGQRLALPAPHRHRPGPPGPGTALGLRLSAAARGERPGPAATPASASSPSVPCLLPPPGGRPAARTGRAGGRAWLKGVAGGEVWRRSPGAWALREHHGGAGRVAGPRPAAPAVARARRPGRRLAHLQGRLRAAGGDRSVERGRGGAGKEGRDAAAGSGPTGARSPLGRARSLRRSHPALQRRLLQTLSVRLRAAPGGGGSCQSPPRPARCGSVEAPLFCGASSLQP